jgi:two-component system, response regulator
VVKVSSTTILLIEDNLDDELMTRHLLRKFRFGNQILAVHDGAEALDFLFSRNAYADRGPNDLPELVLLDIHLPKVNGLEVLHEIRAKHRTRLLPVVMLTSSQDEEDIFESYQSGANAFLRKPLDFSQLVEVVSKLGLYIMIVSEIDPEP